MLQNQEFPGDAVGRDAAWKLAYPGGAKG